MPAAKAASSLDLPSAIPDQNRCSSVRPANGGRPGEGNKVRPDRCDLRLLMPIATSFVQVLRQPFEWKQYAAGASRQLRWIRQLPSARILCQSAMRDGEECGGCEKMRSPEEKEPTSLAPTFVLRQAGPPADNSRLPVPQ